MSKLLPFFTFYGGKYRVAPKYPAPIYGQIVEPFAGSAGYSLRYPDRAVTLNDLDPNVVETWRYLIGASERDVLALPDLEQGQTVDNLAIPEPAKLLVGWWLNKGSTVPKKRASTFMLTYPAGAPYWGESIRVRIAHQLEAIRHWTVSESSYLEIGNPRATWFIDPPYQTAGRHYRFRSVDYGELAEWSRRRNGQVIVAEADGADWLPFRYLAEMDGNEGRQKQARARVETVWTALTDWRDCPDCGGAHDVEACAVTAAVCDCCESIERVS